MATTTEQMGAGPTHGPPTWARWVNLVLGAWLFISAFAWAHSPASFTNTWIMGIVIAAVAVLAMASPPARWINAAAGLWVLISAFALKHGSLGTIWNNAIVGAVVAFFSMAPSARVLGRRVAHG